MHGLTNGILSTHARALREYAHALADSDAKHSRQLWHEAARFSRWAVPVTWFIRSQYAAVLRERSLLLAEKGRLKLAWKTAKKYWIIF